MLENVASDSNRMDRRVVAETSWGVVVNTAFITVFVNLCRLRTISKRLAQPGNALFYLCYIRRGKAQAQR